MTRHGTSHALSVIICSVSSSMLIEMMRQILPEIHQEIMAYSHHFINWSGLPMSTYGLSFLTLASLLAMIWGMAFAVLHAD